MTKSIGVKKAVLNGLRFTGIHRAFAPLSGGVGAILTFHRVRPASGRAFAPNANLEITPEFFAKSLAWLRHRRIDIITLDEALERLAAHDRRRFVVLTFDDGYRDNRDYALPLLKQHRAPAMLYVPTGFIDRTADPWWMTVEEIVRRGDHVSAEIGGDRRTFPARTSAEKHQAYNTIVDWLARLDEDGQRAAVTSLAERHGFDVRAMIDAEFMDWDELSAYAAEPLIGIGGHTVNHFALARLSADRVRREVLEGAEILRQRLGRKPRHFAYPYGFDGLVSPREPRILAELGFATAVRTEPGTLSPSSLDHPMALPRISVNGHFQTLPYFEVLLSGVPFALRDVASRLWGRRRDRSSAPLHPVDDPGRGRHPQETSASIKHNGDGGAERHQPRRSESHHEQGVDRHERDQDQHADEFAGSLRHGGHAPSGFRTLL